MPHRTSRHFGAATGLVALILSGCYEYEDPPVPPAAPSASSAMAPEGGAPPATGSSSASASSARPSRAGAKHAAQRTVDRIEERQRELEKALDDEN